MVDLDELYAKIDELKATLVSLKECIQCLELKDIEGVMFIPYQLGDRESLCLFLCSDCTDNPDDEKAKANFDMLCKSNLESKFNAN